MYRHRSNKAILFFIFCYWILTGQGFGDTLLEERFPSGSFADHYFLSVQQTGDGGCIVSSIWYYPDWYGYIWKTGTNGWQAPKYDWEAMNKTIPWVRQTTDGGFVVAVNTIGAGAPNPVEIKKYDANGNFLWSNGLYDGNSRYRIEQILETNDNTFVICGSKDLCFDDWCEDSNRKLLIAEFDSSGGLLWEKSLPYADGNAIDHTADGGFILAGRKYDRENSRAFLAKTSSNGKLIWEKIFRTGRLNFVQKTRDDGYIAAGWADSATAGKKDVYLLKTSAAGKLEWQKTYGGTMNEWGHQVAQTPSGGYAVVGSTSSVGAGGGDVYLLRTSGGGGLIWEKTFGGTGNDWGYAFDQTSDGGYIIAGSSASSADGTGNDAYLVYFRRDKAACCRAEAEDLDDFQGVDIEPTIEGGEKIAQIGTGDWIMFENVNFSCAPSGFKARVASKTDNSFIELRTDRIDGPLIGTCPIPNTGSWRSWHTITCPVSNPAGMHDLYMIFTEGQCLNWFQFDSESGGTLVESDFNDGPQHFVYHDDTFLNTRRPLYASGTCTPSNGYGGSGGLHVAVGSVDGRNILDGMSGGWSREFYLDKASDVQIILRYRLKTTRYDADECGEALVAIDGDIVMNLAKLCGRGLDTGWSTEAFIHPLPEGRHTLTVGACSNKKTGPLEKADAYFDDISVKVASAPAPETDCSNSIDDDGDELVDCQDPDCADAIPCGEPSMPAVDFNTCDQGFVYRDDTFNNTKHPGYASGDCTAGGGTSGSGGLHVAPGNVDGRDILDGISGGWTGDFYLNDASDVRVSLDYRLVMTRFDADECAQVLAKIDDGPIEVLDMLCGRRKDTGWQPGKFTRTLAPGRHTVTAGGYVNKKTGQKEIADIYFDNLEIR